MISRLRTIGLFGLETFPVDVEVTFSKGKERFTIVGLGDNAVNQAKERVRAALLNLKYYVPDQTIVNLAPAELQKEGSSFDLSIALAVLACTGQINESLLEERCFLGELALDGSLRPIRGVLTLVSTPYAKKYKEIVVPINNLEEAKLLGSKNVIGISSLAELLRYLKKGELVSEQNISSNPSTQLNSFGHSLNEVWGQEVAKRALTIAAAGGHNVLMVGPPGCGKSMLAKRFSTILPKPHKSKLVEIVSIHSAMGQDVTKIIQGYRPFRAPHHSISEAGLIGGGTNVKAGEITLSHGGVLFLDEFPEFKRTSLEALRAPLENGHVTVSRAKSNKTFPADFQLIAAMNPCPCGKYGYGKGKQSCLCSPNQIEKYLAKLSYPILDRIDLQVELEAVPLNVISEIQNGRQETFDYARAVDEAKNIQISRNQILNSKLEAEDLKKSCNLNANSKKFFIDACSKLNISARSFVRILRVARTIADLSSDSSVEEAHLAEALSYRALSRIKESVSMS